MIPICISAIENDDDRTFMERLYREYYNLMYSKAYDILHDRETVEDVINNACIKLISKIQKLRMLNCCVLASYIVYTVKSAAIDYIRKESRSPGCKIFDIGDDAADMLPDGEDTPEQLLLDKERVDKMAAAMDLLPEKQRMILYFKYFCDMSDKEISTAFGISPDSVRMYLSRARKMLLKLLEKEEDLFGLK